MQTLLRRLGTAILFAVIAICFAPTLAPIFLDRIYYEGPPSGHFDGRRFFNPGHQHRTLHHGPERFFNRWVSADRKAVWPSQVPVRQTVPPRRVGGEEMVVTWIGHATVLVQTGGLNILTDPIWSERASPFSFAGPKRVRPPGVRFEDLPGIDLVLVSHNHYDHMDLPTLKRLWERDRPLIVTSLGNQAILATQGIGAAAIDWDDARPIPGGEVRVVRNHHWSSRWGADANRALWSAFTVKVGGSSLFFAGDTGWGDGNWVEEAARLGPYRLAIIPIGAYQPRDIMRENHIDPDEAVRVFQTLKPAKALGVHWGTFQLTFEPIDEPWQRLRSATAAQGIAADKFIATEVGRSFSVPAR